MTVIVISVVIFFDIIYMYVNERHTLDSL